MNELEKVRAAVEEERRSLIPGQGMSAARRRAVIAWMDAKLNRILRAIDEIEKEAKD